MDSVRKKVLNRMHEMEVGRIVKLAEAGEITRNALLLIDGSIEFYNGLERHKEAFRNVVGVSKSFDLHRTYRKGRNAEAVGSIISRLPTKHRTQALEIKHRNLKIASWYLRLNGRDHIRNLDHPDGVVKIETFPDDPSSTQPSMDAARCDQLSAHVFALRDPTTPNTDSRWASHLYPIHLTERYIKTRFRNNRTIRACL